MAATSQRVSARRAELLEIAAELFATRGYAHTTVRDIAEAAGMLSGSLYHHFASKEAILDEILRDFLGDLNERFAEIADGPGTPQERLDGLVRHAFSVIHDRQHAVALYQHESKHLAEVPGFAFVGETSRNIEQTWLRTLEAGQTTGDFRPELNVDLVYRFIREAVWATVRWYRPRGRLKHTVVADHYLRHYPAPLDPTLPPIGNLVTFAAPFGGAPLANLGDSTSQNIVSWALEGLVRSVEDLTGSERLGGYRLTSPSIRDNQLSLLDRSLAITPAPPQLTANAVTVPRLTLPTTWLELPYR
jgi:AcrR family transcriptional regulator